MLVLQDGSKFIYGYPSGVCDDSTVNFIMTDHATLLRTLADSQPKLL